MMNTVQFNRSQIAAFLALGLNGPLVLASGDCNSNAITDADEILSGRSIDANGNGVPDSCEGLATGPVLRSIAINMGPSTCGWWTTTPRGAWFAWVSRDSGVGPWVNGSSAAGNTQKLDMQLVAGVQTIHVRCNSNGCGSNYWGLGLWFEEVGAPQLAVSPGTPSLEYDGPIPAPYLPGSPLQSGNGATSTEVGPWTVAVLSYTVADSGDLVGPTSLGGGNGVDHLATLVIEVTRTELTFNELRTKQPGNDVDEYVEFIGTPGASLAGLTYIVLGDRAGTATNPVDNSGYVEMALPLDGAVVPADGRLLIAEPTVSFPLDVDWVTPTDGLLFEDNNTARTHLIVAGWSGAVNTDLDTNNDGILDSTPWLSVISSVAVLGPFTTDQVYSPNTIPADVTSTGTFTAGHGYRCSPDNQWTVGAVTFYPGGGDTPGAVNRACSAGPVLECGEATAGACNAEHATPFCSDLNCCNAVCVVDPDCCVTAWDAACVAQAATSCAAATASCEFIDVRLNEIRSDMAGTDTLEFVELAGTPGTALDDLTLVVIGDGSTATLSGVVERARSLAGVVMPADGTLLIGNPAVTPDVGNGAATGGANLTQDWFENSDNLTFLLVRGWNGAVAADLDTNDDGTLDSTPWIEIVDSIALVESAFTPPIGTEYAYGANRIGPDGVNVPGHVWRCQDTGCWNIGLFDRTANQTAGNETPGADNLGCVVVTCPGDISGDNLIDAGDLKLILAAWGSNGQGQFSTDPDGSGLVDGGDLALVLSGWGPCP